MKKTKKQKQNKKKNRNKTDAKYFMLINSTNKKRIQEGNDGSTLHLQREDDQKEHK